MDDWLDQLEEQLLKQFADDEAVPDDEMREYFQFLRDERAAGRDIGPRLYMLGELAGGDEALREEEAFRKSQGRRPSHDEVRAWIAQRKAKTGREWGVQGEAARHFSYSRKQISRIVNE